MQKIIGYILLALGVILSIGVLLVSVIGSFINFDSGMAGSFQNLPMGTIMIGIFILLAGVVVTVTSKNK